LTAPGFTLERIKVKKWFQSFCFQIRTCTATPRPVRDDAEEAAMADLGLPPSPLCSVRLVSTYEVGQVDPQLERRPVSFNP
jgi:hypothetical protein